MVRVSVVPVSPMYEMRLTTEAQRRGEILIEVILISCVFPCVSVSLWYGNTQIQYSTYTHSPSLKLRLFKLNPPCTLEH